VGSKKGGKVEPRHRVRRWSRCTLKGRPSSEEFGKAFFLLSTPRKSGPPSPRALPRELRGTNRSTSQKQTFRKVCQAVSKFKKELTFSLGVLFEGGKSRPLSRWSLFSRRGGPRVFTVLRFRGLVSAAAYLVKALKPCQVVFKMSCGLFLVLISIFVFSSCVAFKVSRAPRRSSFVVNVGDDGYGLIGSLTRRGPVPFFIRVFKTDTYEAAVNKYMLLEKVSRTEAQAEMDTYFENPNGWAAEKLREKNGGPKIDRVNVNQEPVSLALTAVWALGITSLFARILFVQLQ